MMFPKFDDDLFCTYLYSTLFQIFWIVKTLSLQYYSKNAPIMTDLVTTLELMLVTNMMRYK
jgi:hypothetical protein